MMSLVVVAISVGAALGCLIRLGFARSLRPFVAASLLIGAAGYVLQGSPMLPSSPARSPAGIEEDRSGLLALRAAMPGGSGSDRRILLASDQDVKAGDWSSAVQLLKAGIEARPTSAVLWTELGMVVAGHDGGRLTPPALFAFQRAFELSPSSPAPPFFLGILEVQNGNLEDARVLWERSASLSPPKAIYRGLVDERLAMLNNYLDGTKR
jgi:hypothetical protein